MAATPEEIVTQLQLVDNLLGEARVEVAKANGMLDELAQHYIAVNDQPRFNATRAANEAVREITTEVNAADQASGRAAGKTRAISQGR